jgi:glycolate oxidase iron-sulfur subunit
MTAAGSIIRSCVHCGFCTATCPTYVLLGDERDSPRGRIQLVKAMLDKGGAPDPATVRHIDRCLSCLACVTTCPSGVDYQHLIDTARAYIEANHRRPLGERVLRWLLAMVLPRPALLRLALTMAPLGRPFAGLLPPGIRVLLDLSHRVKAGGKRVASMSAADPVRMHVALLTGCVQDVVATHVHHATVRVLTRHGISVHVRAGASCCGALPHHLGRDAQAKASAQRAIDAWMPLIERKALAAIVVNASGCGTMLKDYAHLLADDPEYAGPARQVAAISLDVSELLDGIDLRPRPDLPALTVAYHPACSLNHGQRVRAEPRRLLEAVGFRVVSIADEHLCCGSAGVYNILQPDIAARLRDRKAASIRATGAMVLASGNVGCNTHLAGAVGMPVVNTVELLDWATGGPVPPAIAAAGILSRIAE